MHLTTTCRVLSDLRNIIKESDKHEVIIERGYDDSNGNGWLNREPNGTKTFTVKINGGAVNRIVD